MTVSNPTKTIRKPAATNNNVSNMPQMAQPSTRSNEMTRPGRIPESKAADGYVNLYVEDLDGNRHSIKVTIPLHDGYGRPLDEAILNRLRQYDADMADYNELVAAGKANSKTKVPAKPEFKFGADVVLVAPKLPPRF